MTMNEKYRGVPRNPHARTGEFIAIPEAEARARDQRAMNAEFKDTYEEAHQRWLRGEPSQE